MANNLNHITVSGRLTKDVVLKETRNESYIAVFDIACNYYAGKNDPHAVAFIPVRAFSSTAEFIGKYFHKGDEIYIDGTLKEDRWEKDGQYRSSIYVLASEVFFGPRKRPEGAQEEEEKLHAAEDSKEYAPIEGEGDLPF